MAGCPAVSDFIPHSSDTWPGFTMCIILNITASLSETQFFTIWGSPRTIYSVVYLFEECCALPHSPDPFRKDTGQTPLSESGSPRQFPLQFSPCHQSSPATFPLTGGSPEYWALSPDVWPQRWYSNLRKVRWMFHRY